MYCKILIKGKIEILTGLHIGTGGDYAAIGAADSPVVRDVISNMPIIPGSSFKGKLRSLLCKKYNTTFASTPFEDNPSVIRLFGGKINGKITPSRFIFSDMPISNINELEEMGVNNPTEIKYENTISRTTSIANPRQIERVIRQCKFALNIIYNIGGDPNVELNTEKKEAKEDISMLIEGLKLLEYDYLGGHGSRGYGKIKFSELNIESVAGNEEGEFDDVIAECYEKIKEVSENEI